MGALGTVHPTPVRAHFHCVRTGVGMISTVGSPTYAELTGPGTTPDHGRDVSALSRVRPDLARATFPRVSQARDVRARSGAIRTRALCGRQAGPSVRPPCSRGGGQRLRGGRLHDARWSIYRRREAPGRCAPGWFRARGCCLTPRCARAVRRHSVGFHSLELITLRCRTDGVSGTVSPSVVLAIITLSRARRNVNRQGPILFLATSVPAPLPARGAHGPFLEQPQPAPGEVAVPLLGQDLMARALSDLADLAVCACPRVAER